MFLALYDVLYGEGSCPEREVTYTKADKTRNRRASILKLLRSSGIDSNKLILPAFVAYAKPIPTRFLAPMDYSNSSTGLRNCLEYGYILEVITSSRAQYPQTLGGGGAGEGGLGGGR